MPTKPLSKCHKALIWEERSNTQKNPKSWMVCAMCLKPCDVIEPTALESEREIICTKCGNPDYIMKDTNSELCGECKRENFIELIV